MLSFFSNIFLISQNSFPVTEMSPCLKVSVYIALYIFLLILAQQKFSTGTSLHLASLMLS